MHYNVNLWGSHPDDGNDDCWTGADFRSEAEALAAFANPLAHGFRRADLQGSAYLEVTVDVGVTPDGTTVVERLHLRKNPDYRPTRDDDSDWRREQAMQAGMAFGVAGYNDYMGY